ncbi:hypothetical protein DYY67_0690 [Candidatus Nitrosotalea sp. TS]|nr:hypothetical protein [Candidatus Nitrosotalea sp. TS]
MLFRIQYLRYYLLAQVHSRTQTCLLFPCIPHAFRQNICGKEPCYSILGHIWGYFYPPICPKTCPNFGSITSINGLKWSIFGKIIFCEFDAQRLNPRLFFPYREEGDFFIKCHFLGGFNTCAYIWQPRVKTPPLPGKSLLFFLWHG